MKTKVKVTVTLQCLYFMNGEWKVKKRYQGNGTWPIPYNRPVIMGHTPEETLQKKKEEMLIEAERDALKQCLCDRLGYRYYDFKDIVIDEFNRPIKLSGNYV